MSAITPRRLAAILHADVAGYSRLMGANEEDTLGRLTAYRTDMAAGIEQHGGRVVDTAGDSLLAEFSSVVEATRCALELQDMLKARNSDVPPDRRLEFRMGIEMADVLTHEDGVYGDGVNVAARLQALAEPGGVCVSDAVRRAVANRLPLSFESLGEHSVKNIAEPIRAFRVLRQDEAAPTLTTARVPAKRLNQLAIIGIVAGAAALIALSTVWVFSHKENPQSGKAATKQAAQVTSPAPPVATAPSDKPSIAVLPFVNLSGDKEQEYFSDGISEDIIIDLSRVSNLQVIARNSSFYYKGKSVKTEDVGRELGVEYVLSGSVRKAGDRVRVTAQLVNSKDAHQLWADKFDRKLEDIFAVQDEITQKIVAALVVQLSSREKANLAIKATQNVKAYDMFLKGRQAYGTGTKEGLETAAALYRDAIALDPRFGRAYGALAVTMTRAMVRGFTEHSAQKLDQALELAQQAVSLNSNLPETYWALGYVHRHRSEGESALAAAQRSIEIAPNYADGYALLASIQNQNDNGKEAIRLINRAMALNPRYTWEYPNVLGRGYYSLAEYGKAVEAFRDALARNEIVSVPRVFLISSYVRLGRIDDARWEVTQLQTFNPQVTISQFKRQAYFWDKKALDRFLADLKTAGMAP